MRFFQPTQTQQTSWEGEEIPPLRMRGEKRSVLNASVAPATSASSPTLVLAAPKASSRGNWFKQQALVLLCIAVFSVPAYYLASRFIVTAVIIQGRSMSPTLNDGDRYYLNRWRYLFLAPQRGDVVVIKDPGHGDFAVKRIVARPYDWLNLKDGLLYVNGKRLAEPYLADNTRTDVPDRTEKWIQLGRDQYFLLGDNRSNSEDSRFYGVIHRRNIVGMLIK